MKKLFAILGILLFSFSAEAGIPLTKDNTNSRPMPKVIKRKKHRIPTYKTDNPKKKSVPTQSSFSYFGPLTPQMSALLEQFADDRSRSEYLEKQNYVTESTNWAKYVNKRLGFSVEYPDIFPKEMKKPPDSDGLWVESFDENVKLTVLGSYNTTGQTAKEFLNIIYSQANNVVILEEESEDNWYRFIYRGYCNTIHRYGIITENLKVEFILGYPNGKEETFQSVAERMEQTLQLGD